MTWGLARSGFRSSPIVAAVAGLLLDSLAATVGGAWGFRKLRTGYAGPCLRVRRSSDNTEADIGFAGTGLDVAALLAFCGSSSGYLTKWYDQSLVGAHFIQTVATNQPLIVSSGVVSALPNATQRPGLMMISASQTFMAVPSLQTLSATTFSLHTVAARTSSIPTNGRLASISGNPTGADYNNDGCIFAFWNGNNALGYRGGNGSVVSLTTLPFQLSSMWTATSPANILALDGVSAGAAGGGGQLVNPGYFEIGATPYAHGEAWDGVQCEHLLLLSDASLSDLSLIRSSQRSYYGTP